MDIYDGKKNPSPFGKLNNHFRTDFAGIFNT